ncbi:Ubiquitin thioesterase trabid [Eumeta japonica]|uniref:ubiquitinyl hydrolase 1 n=1 Tax=Eumeta variegata TaxID=151549 RepID=A0A4C1URG1_EUMVA|nr:Ubiquitin thioesterase trabid [Eumeta japonica]
MSEEVQDDASTRNKSPIAQHSQNSETHGVDVSTNVSQIQLNQCTMCRSLKPSLGEDIFKLQDGASALPASNDSGAEAVVERLKPLRISSPQGQPSASSISKWSCPTCTYENWPKTLKCAMCSTSNPVPSAAAPERPHRNIIGINDICNNQNELHDIDNSGRRSKRRNTDWLWLQACLGVVEGDRSCVEAYLASGGDPARALTAAEVQLLNRASAFDAGHTLVHLAIRFQREDILSSLLSRISGGGSGVKRAPSYIAPDLAKAIRRHIASLIRTKKGSFACRYITEFCTFSLPAEIEELPAAIQEQLFSELLDRDAQQTLEAEPALINWSLELTMRLGSRLYALWNRSAGDCLLDAVSQAAYGVFDRDNTLRRALADTLHHASRSFYERWHAWECLQATLLQYTPEESQLRSEWARLVAAAAMPGTPLHQLHVFALAHVMRRPIIVYGVNIVNSFRGEAIGYARFQGVYLPLLWEPEFCSKSPLCVGYTRGHFSALVPCEPDTAHRTPYICRWGSVEGEAGVVRRWVSTCMTAGGLLAARQRLHPRPLLVAQMLEEWLNHYRRLAQQTRGPFPPRLHPAAAEFSSDADTDEE